MKPETNLPARIAALALTLLLAACAAPPPPATGTPTIIVADTKQVDAAVAVPAPAISDPAPKIVQPLPQTPGIVEVLLNYQQSLLLMTREEVAREVANLPQHPVLPENALKKAMALATRRGQGDLLRAQQLAEQVLASNDSAAYPAHSLARWLVANYAELRRLSEQSEKLAQQTREQQRRIDQLDQMLENLKAIERNLATRPTPPASSTR